MTPADIVTVVSGLPRSGTSLMMRALEAGGLPPLADGQRAPDDDNPAGYYELERVKGLPHDVGWLADARGKAVKVISQLLLALPREPRYAVLFMRRDIDEVLASQERMLARRGRAASGDRAGMRALLLRHAEQVLSAVAARPEMRLLSVDYNRLLSPDALDELTRVTRFLGGLDPQAMLGAIQPALYRNRAPG